MWLLLTISALSLPPLPCGHPHAASVYPAPCGGYVWAVQPQAVRSLHGDPPRLYAPVTGWAPDLDGALRRVELLMRLTEAAIPPTPPASARRRH